MAHAEASPEASPGDGSGLRFFATAQLTASSTLNGYEELYLDADQTAFGLEYRSDVAGVPVRVLFEVSPLYNLDVRRAFVDVGPVRVGQDFSATLNEAYVGEGVHDVNFTGNEPWSIATAGLIQTPMEVAQFRAGGFVFSFEVPLEQEGTLNTPFVLAARYDGTTGAVDWSIGGFADRIDGSEYGFGASVGGKLHIGRDDLRAYVIGGSGVGDVFGYYRQQSVSQDGDQVARVGGRVSYRHWWTQRVRSNAYVGYLGEQPYFLFGTMTICCSGGGASTYRVSTERYDESKSIGLNLIATFGSGIDVGVEGTWGQIYSRQFRTNTLISGPGYPSVPATVDNDYKAETDRVFVFIRARY